MKNFKIEKENTFAFIQNTDAPAFHVFIDSSFIASKDTCRSGRRAKQAHAVGWAMYVGDKQKAHGYGAIGFWEDYSRNSTLGELRGIIRFFDMLDDEHPEMISKDKMFIVHCDNIEVSRMLNETVKNEKFSRATYRKFGNDFVRILNYMTRTQIRFKWVKGHANQLHNSIADSFASAVRFRMIEQGFVPGSQMASIAENVLFSRNLISRSGKKHQASERMKTSDRIKEETGHAPDYTSILLRIDRITDSNRIQENLLRGVWSYETSRKEAAVTVEGNAKGYTGYFYQIRMAALVLFEHRLSDNFAPGQTVVIRGLGVDAQRIAARAVEGASKPAQNMNKQDKRAVEFLQTAAMGIPVSFHRLETDEYPDFDASFRTAAKKAVRESKAFSTSNKEENAV